MLSPGAGVYPLVYLTKRQKVLIRSGSDDLELLEREVLLDEPVLDPEELAALGRGLGAEEARQLGAGIDLDDEDLRGGDLQAVGEQDVRLAVHDREAGRLGVDVGGVDHLDLRLTRLERGGAVVDAVGEEDAQAQ